MEQDYLENWFYRASKVIIICDDVSEGNLPLLPEIVTVCVEELTKLIYFATHHLPSKAPNFEQNKQEIKSLITELNQLKSEFEEWKERFKTEKFRIKTLKTQTLNKSCLVCSRKLHSNYGYILSIEFYYDELELWIEEHRTQPVGPTCIEKFKKPFELEKYSK